MLEPTPGNEDDQSYNQKNTLWESTEDTRAVWLLKNICALLQIEVLNKPILIYPKEPDKEGMEVLLS